MTKNTVVQVRMSEEEKTRWAAEAQRSDLSLSDWIRRQCNGVEYRPKGAKEGAILPNVPVIPDVGKGARVEGAMPEPRLPGAVTKPTVAVCTKHKLVEPCRRCL